MQQLFNRPLRLALLITLAPLAIASPASADFFHRSYSLSVAPGSPSYEAAPGEVASGQTVSITATVKNESHARPLGAANLFWPRGFKVLSATSSAGTATIDTATSWSRTCTDHGFPVGPCVELRDFVLPPGQSLTVTMSVATPACQQGSDFTWVVDAEHAHGYHRSRYQSSLINSRRSGARSSSRWHGWHHRHHVEANTTLDGACSLSWSTEPNNAGANAVITSNSNAAGPAPAVTVVDEHGNPINGSTAPVSVALATNLHATLNGTLTQPANGTTGTASFADLSINQPATGYQLGASSGTLDPATSTAFDVTDEAVSCDPSNPASCKTTVGTPNGNQGTVQATPTSSGVLVESVNANNGAQLTCSGYTSTDPNTYQFDAPAGWGKLVTLTIRPLTKLSGRPGDILEAQQICFGAPEDFTTASGTLAPPGTLPDGTAGFIGLLPDCGAGITGPCHNRKQDTTISDPLSPYGFDLVLVADIPATFAGDPHMR